MPGELWEIVRAGELKVGDVVRQSVKEWPIEIEFMDFGRSCVFVNGSRTYQGSEKILRRYTGHHPDVLMRVIKLMMAYIDEEQLQNVPIEQWIEQAEAEIAKERE